MHSMLENKENTHGEIQSIYIYVCENKTLSGFTKEKNTGRGFCDCKLQRNQCKHCTLQHKGVCGW